MAIEQFLIPFHYSSRKILDHFLKVGREKFTPETFQVVDCTSGAYLRPYVSLEGVNVRYVDSKQELWGVLDSYGRRGRMAVVYAPQMLGGSWERFIAALDLRSWLGRVRVLHPTRSVLGFRESLPEWDTAGAVYAAPILLRDPELMARRWELLYHPKTGYASPYWFDSDPGKKEHDASSSTGSDPHVRSGQGAADERIPSPVGEHRGAGEDSEGGQEGASEPVQGLH